MLIFCMDFSLVRFWIYYDSHFADELYRIRNGKSVLSVLLQTMWVRSMRRKQADDDLLKCVGNVELLLFLYLFLYRFSLLEFRSLPPSFPPSIHPSILPSLPPSVSLKAVASWWPLPPSCPNHSPSLTRHLPIASRRSPASSWTSSAQTCLTPSRSSTLCSTREV
jgi:hypothetical protein